MFTRVIFILLVCLASPLSAAVKGLVYSNDGKPVANATVEVFAVERYEDTVDRLFSGTPEIGPLATATTDARGAFSADAKKSGVVSLRISARDHAPIRTIVTAGTEDLVLIVRAVRLRTGRVTTDSRPVASATVTLLDSMGQPLATVQTDQQGKYKVADPMGTGGTICIRHKDLAPTCSSIYENHGVQLDVKMIAGRRVTGRVVGADGQGVAGARIHAGGWTVARSQDDGTFVISHLPEGSAHIRALAGTAMASAPAALETATLTLAPGVSLSGTTLDDKGHPLQGALITVVADTEHANPEWYTAITDAKGVYRVDGLPPGKYTIYPSVPDEWDADSKEIDLRRQKTAQHDFTLKAAEFLRGTVRDEKNAPVAGAILFGSNTEMPLIYGTGSWVPVLAATGPGGQFKIPLPSRENPLIVVMKSGYAAAKHAVDSPSKKPISIILPRGVTVTGVVVDAAGTPQGDVAVMAAEAKSLGSFPLGATLAAGQVQPWVKTGPDGRFTIHLNPGVHDLGIWKTPFAAHDVSGVEVSERMSDLKVTLETGVEIRGRVARGKGPLPDGGQIVAMSPELQTGAQGELQSDGSFVIAALRPGKYLIAYSGQNSSAQKMVDAPAADVVIELPELTEITGRAVDKSTGFPITSYTVTASDTERRFYESSEVNDPTGVFTHNAPAGPVEVTVQAPGYVAEKQIVDGSQAVKELVFSLTRGRKIAGRVTSSNGPVASAEVAVFSDAGDNTSVTTDEAGEYELTGVSLATTTIGFRAKGFASQSEEVAAGTSDHRLDVTLVNGLKVKGRVVDGNGAPVEEAMVYAYSAAHAADSQSATTAKDGTFTMEGLAPAHYDFRARKSSGGEAELADVDVAKTPSIVLTIETEGKSTVRGMVAGVAGAGWMMAMVYASNGDDSATAQVGRDGTFVMENAPAGELTVRAMMMAIDREGSTSATKVTVGEGQTAEVHLAVATDPVIRGTVTANGKPLSGAHVSFQATDDDGMWGRWRATTDAAGTYEIKGITPGEYAVQVSQLSDERFRGRYGVTGTTTYDIVIEQARIEGRVVDEAGNPISEARIDVGAPADDDHSKTASAVSDSSGHFGVQVQAGARYRVTANRKGFAAASSMVDASAASPVILKLARAEGTAVRIVDSRNGATLSGYVVVTDETGANQITVAQDRQSDGSLHLPLPAGKYRISASASDYSSATMHVSVPSPVETRLALTPGGTLFIKSKTGGRHLIKLTQPNGEEYIRCHCNGIAEIRIEGATTTVDHVAPGSYVMSVIDNGVVKKTYPVTIIEAQSSTIEIAE